MLTAFPDDAKIKKCLVSKDYIYDTIKKTWFKNEVVGGTVKSLRPQKDHRYYLTVQNSSVI